MKITKNYTIADIETQIENGVAQPIKSAGFEQGDEGEVKTTFFKLWGSVVRKVHNRSTTVREYFFVKGDDLEMFVAHYG
jgi:hypothetical protein